MTARSPILDPGFAENPHPAIDRLRAEDPVHFVEGLGVWVVTRFDDVRALFGDGERVTARGSAASRFVPAPEGSFRRWFDEHGVQANDAAAHARARRLASQAFTPRAVARMEQQAHEVVTRIAAPLHGRRGVVDLVGEFTNRIPNAVISRITGVPPAGDDEARFGALARDTVRGLFPFAGDEATAAMERAGPELAAWVREMAAERLRRPQDDLISDLCRASEDGNRLTPEDVVAWVTALIAAGSDTTAMAATSALLTLLERPADLARLRAERSLVPRAVSELLRFTLVGSLPRYALRDFELRGKAIRRGDTLLLCLAGANRDPAVYPDPHRFALKREFRQVTYFGNGERYCIGANLARAELAWMIGAALDFLPPDARVLHEQAKRSTLGFVLRHDTLPVDFGRACRELDSQQHTATRFPTREGDGMTTDLGRTRLPWIEQIEQSFEVRSFGGFHRRELPPLIERHGHLVARDLCGAPPLAFRSEDGETFSWIATRGGVQIAEGDADAATLVEIPEQVFSNFLHELLTASGAVMTERARVVRGSLTGWQRWEPAIQALCHGRPIYGPDVREHLVDGAGRTLDLHRSFAIDDPEDEMRAYFDTLGYLHVRSVFTPEEVAFYAAEVERCRARTTSGDGNSWWSVNAAGREVITRINYLDRFSSALLELAHDPRLARFARLAGPELRVCDDRLDGPMVFIKSARIVKGNGDLTWHVDDGLGGHPVMCPLIQAGIQLDPANAANGQLLLLAGSHRHAKHWVTRGEEGDLPVVALETQPGDLTLHYGDTMHSTPPPTSDDAGRRVLYYKFARPKTFDWIPARCHYNDVLFRRQQDGRVAADATSGTY